MGNQGSPNPSFFYYDDFTSFVVMACVASLRCAVLLRRIFVRSLRSRAKRAHRIYTVQSTTGQVHLYVVRIVLYCNALRARVKRAHIEKAQEDGAAERSEASHDDER